MARQRFIRKNLIDRDPFFDNLPGLPGSPPIKEIEKAPGHISIVSIKIPNRIRPKEISASDLPANWRNYPPPAELATLGTRWALANDTLLVRVPSPIVEQEFNILINLSHGDMKHHDSQEEGEEGA